jgi:acyl-CoA synthetase (AMP-forming)/AMP-acid ligase II
MTNKPMTTERPDESSFIPFHKLIEAQATSNPDGVAFSVEDRSLGWAELRRNAVCVAHALIRSGIAPKDKVAVLGLPSLSYVECIFGIVAARACVVPLPVSASPDSLEAMLADSGAKLLFLDPDAGKAAKIVAERFVSKSGAAAVVQFGEAGADGVRYTHWRSLGANDRGLPQPLATDAFNIIYSSGTTGVPKGIVHSHGMRQRQAMRNGFALDPASKMLLSTPMYSNTTITPMIGTLAHGGECRLMRKFDAGRYLAVASAWHATHTMLVPVQYQRLLAHAGFAGTDLSAFQLSQSTGAPMGVALKRDILARWPGRFREVYGLTEGGVSCFLEMHAHPDKLHTVGQPVHGTEVFLIDEDGRKLPPTSDGQEWVGEVVGRSPFMMTGYHQREDANDEIRWRDGRDAQAGAYHRTGDIGRFDADGFLILLDRRKDVIISGGNNIYAADLEAVLARHPDVQDCAVIGVPSEQWGETPLALVVIRRGSALDAPLLREWVNAQVGKTQRLSAVELREALPRSALGKLSKKALRAPYWNLPG